jgi:hypothetical protein
LAKNTKTAKIYHVLLAGAGMPDFSWQKYQNRENIPRNLSWSRDARSQSNDFELQRQRCKNYQSNW